VIADRTAYDVWYAIANYHNRFRLQVYTNGWYARSDSTGRVYERTQTLIHSSVTNTDHWAWQTQFSSSRSQWITESNTISARLIVWLKKLTFAFSSIRFYRTMLHRVVPGVSRRVYDRLTWRTIDWLSRLSRLNRCQSTDWLEHTWLTD